MGGIGEGQTEPGEELDKDNSNREKQYNLLKGECKAMMNQILMITIFMGDEIMFQ